MLFLRRMWPQLGFAKMTLPPTPHANLSRILICFVQFGYMVYVTLANNARVSEVAFARVDASRSLCRYQQPERAGNVYQNLAETIWISTR